MIMEIMAVEKDVVISEVMAAEKDVVIMEIILAAADVEILTIEEVIVAIITRMKIQTKAIILQEMILLKKKITTMMLNN